MAATCSWSLKARSVAQSQYQISPVDPVLVPACEDVDALAQAGADIIAIDGTDRPRPVPVETLLARIHHHGLLAMTDCSTR